MRKIVDESEELKDLQLKLKSVTINRERALQMKEVCLIAAVTVSHSSLLTLSHS